MAENYISLSKNDQDQPCQLPILTGTLGPSVIDIRSLYAKTGHFTYDPGFTSTASCTSKITFIDGDAGVLLYRGYPIEQLAEKCDFLEVCYLLLNGDLPNGGEMKSFVTTVSQHVMVHEQLTKFYSGFRRDAHPMAVMVGVVGALSAFYHDVMDINSREDRYISAIRLIAKMPAIVAMCYKYSIGMPFIYPKRKLGYAENFMRMMHGDPSDDYLANPVLVRALDRILILHADHEQNASTSTVRLAGSSGANPYACVAAGIACLWGAAHGGPRRLRPRQREGQAPRGRPFGARRAGRQAGRPHGDRPRPRHRHRPRQGGRLCGCARPRASETRRGHDL